MATVVLSPSRKLMRGVNDLCSPFHPQRVRFQRAVFALILFIMLYEAIKRGFPCMNPQIRSLHFPGLKFVNTSLSNYSSEVTISSKLTKTLQNKSSISDDFPFKYLINEPDFCTRRSNLYVINIVGVAPWEIRARTLIRSLWAHETWQNKTGFRTVFVTGIVTDHKLMAALREESNKYHDILQFNFLDTYDNLSLKTLCGLHWVNNFCSTPVWVLKSDTDVMVNTFRLTRYLHEYDEKTNHSRNHFLCKPRGPASPCRTGCRKVKWRVSWEEYPHNRYPVYCMGPGYVIPRQMVPALYQAANKTHPFRLEDVYYTGIIPKQLNWGNMNENIGHLFPWRPVAWQNSFVKSDLMILELDKGLGQSASTTVWTKILQSMGLERLVQNEKRL
ncbi:UDP-GalNAc:beta-1,3-N-acetylgalactosaminyltransferase 1-like [Homarus americanus]|uniref:Hexosyltransferase n=1 Tax=Homarus americanus TaxID=6706 RepID=A0A8J5N5J0_HOMAM|nr:UDP-GalNAc:beta-1,3-N-acetylgalactosaminyltransferase 1-like [Homarus americanus]XP_042213645.1 UDP-GalNAc:beta-1,3-N-acetylgalactosaminyltransferase 1-like [Homarus americanus]KAG7173434.1 Beta-1-3-galactosyltransferase 2-like [Homarus americanus]